MTRISIALQLATLAIALVSLNVEAQLASSTNSPYSMCKANNAEGRKQLAGAPQMPTISKRLMSMVIEDQICDCMKAQEPKPAKDSADPNIRYISANATCLPEHVKREFTANCPDLYQSVFSESGHKQIDPEVLAEICSCASAHLDQNLTPESFKRWQLEQYRYFKVRVEDRKNGTNKAKALEPRSGPFEDSFKGLVACMKQGAN